MAVNRAEVRVGAYYDSVVLMRLQRGLSTLAGVVDAGVVMGTEANKRILAQSGLLTPAAEAAAADDLVIVVRAQDEAAASAAMAQVDALLALRQGGAQHDYQPKSLEGAAKLLPGAAWVLVSVPGRYAAAVAREALHLGKHVFLYSDNVAVQDEVDLKKLASARGLLLMGPDCGTAIVQGAGLGFANRVRRGSIGLVAASGTGLQQVSSLIHQLGGGISQAFGTGGRDLWEAVGAIATLQALDLLRRDPDTRIIVLVSKPPAPAVAERVLETARAVGKPVVVDLIGHASPVRRLENLCFATTFEEAATLAVELAQAPSFTPSQTAGMEGAHAEHPPLGPPQAGGMGRAEGQRFLRGLFSGGTLAYEIQLLLQGYLPEIRSNAPLRPDLSLANSLVSQGHTIVDLGEDEFTVGRLHPMMDNDLRIRRLMQEAADPEVAVIVLDVILGDGAHPDPAGELAPAIAQAQTIAREAGRYLDVAVMLVGTDQDPQGWSWQKVQLEAAGARVMHSNDALVRWVGPLLRGLGQPPRAPTPAGETGAVDLAILRMPFAAINVGLSSFADSLRAQGMDVVHVDWRPPAGGNERLMQILERMKRK